MIFANTYVGARMMFGAPLTDNNVTGSGSLTTEYLYT